jgi:hypothetical protein
VRPLSAEAGVSHHAEPPNRPPLASSWRCAQTSSMTRDILSGGVDGVEALVPVITMRGLRLVHAV